MCLCDCSEPLQPSSHSLPQPFAPQPTAPPAPHNNSIPLSPMPPSFRGGQQGLRKRDYESELLDRLLNSAAGPAFVPGMLPTLALHRCSSPHKDITLSRSLPVVMRMLISQRTLNQVNVLRFKSFGVGRIQLAGQPWCMAPAAPSNINQSVKECTEFLT